MMFLKMQKIKMIYSISLNDRWIFS